MFLSDWRVVGFPSIGGGPVRSSLHQLAPGEELHASGYLNLFTLDGHADMDIEVAITAGDCFAKMVKLRGLSVGQLLRDCDVIWRSRVRIDEIDTLESNEGSTTNL